MKMVLSHVGELKRELFDSISTMDVDDLMPLRQFIRMSSIRSTWSELDLSLALPEDAITSVGSYLDARDLSAWQTCNRTMLQSLDVQWRALGIRRFPNVRLDDQEFFQKANESSSWFLRYTEFSKSLRLAARTGVMSFKGLRKVETDIPIHKKVSCTIPAKFSVSLAGCTFISMTVTVKFSPDAVRSVIGLIDYPSTHQSLECDRGLSRKHWGLAFGPLTGVVSCMGKYFDDFSTYRARHGLKDYLAAAMTESVVVRVGVFVDNGKVAFYRLPESDYADWECTGFVYDCFSSIPQAASVVPSVMFSHIGNRDYVGVSVDGVSAHPPFYPHTNATAMHNWEGWNSFAEDGLEAAVRPPPNSPSTEDVIYE